MTETGRVDRRALLAVLAVGLALRIAWALLVPVAPVSDGHAYHVFATNLLEHGTFGWRADQPDAYWPPGAPALYAAAYWLLGANGLAVVLLNLLLSAAKLALAVSLATRWYGSRAGVLAGFALALWPAQIEFTTVLSSEHAFDVALLVALFAFERSWRAPNARAALALGVALAAASFIRPTALPLAVVFGAIAIFRGAPAARTLASVAFTLVVMVAAIAPWSLRNQRVFGRFVAISANGGANLWMGNNPDSVGVYMALPAEVAGMDAARRNAVLSARAKEWMIEHPLAALELALRKLAITHGRETIGVVWNEIGLAPLRERSVLALKLVSTAFWWGALLAGFAGVALRLRAAGVRALFLEPPLVLWAYFAAVHAITVAQDRYHLSSVPFIAALAGSALAEILARRAPTNAVASTPTPRSAG